MKSNYILFTIVLILAVVYDSFEDRIPNALCMIGGTAAIMEAGYDGGRERLLISLLAAIVLFFLLFPFWRFRIVGAGDVKLIAVSGLFLGRDILCFLMCAGVCTALFSLVFMIHRHNFFQRIHIFGNYIRHCLHKGRFTPYPFDKMTEQREGGIHVTYGLLAGHMLAWIFGIYGR